MRRERAGTASLLVLLVRREKSAFPREGRGLLFCFSPFLLQPPLLLPLPLSLPTSMPGSPQTFTARGSEHWQRTNLLLPSSSGSPFMSGLTNGLRVARLRWATGLPTSGSENLSLFFSPFLSPPHPHTLPPFPALPHLPLPCSPSFPPFSFFLGWALLRLYGIKCAKCSIGFSKNDFVMRARAKVYHIECFRCVACSRQLIPGDEFALREDGLFCRADHDVVERASLGAGDPLSPLHPARPLQMAGTARTRRRGSPRCPAPTGPPPGEGPRRLLRLPRPRGTAAPSLRARGGTVSAARPTPGSAANPAAARKARVRDTREAETPAQGPHLRQPAPLLLPPRTGCGSRPDPRAAGSPNRRGTSRCRRQVCSKAQSPLPPEHTENLF